MEDKTFCPECEIHSMKTEITQEKILEIVNKMAYVEGVTTPDEIFRNRLEICKSCTSLQNKIMCMECGSYIAFRAHNLSSTCPYPGCNKWEQTK